MSGKRGENRDCGSGLPAPVSSSPKDVIIRDAMLGDSVITSSACGEECDFVWLGGQGVIATS
jgi:hypothetical protein